MDELRKIAPVVFGTLFGLYALFSGLATGALVLALIALAVTGLFFRALGRSLLGSQPVAAVRVWQGAVLVPVAVIAATVWAVAELSLAFAGLVVHLPEWLWQGPTTEDELSTAKDLFVGAVSTLAAGLWLDQAKDPAGRLWPAGQIRDGFETVFRPVVNKIKAGEKPLPEGERDHTRLERAITGERLGWGFDDAIRRAQDVSPFL